MLQDMGVPLHPGCSLFPLTCSVLEGWTRAYFPQGLSLKMSSWNVGAVVSDFSWGWKGPGMEELWRKLGTPTAWAGTVLGMCLYQFIYKVKMLSTWSFGAFSIRQTLPGVFGGLFIYIWLPNSDTRILDRCSCWWHLSWWTGQERLWR